MVGRIVIIVIMAMIAFAVSGSVTDALVRYEDRRTKNRPLAYLLCVIIVFAASVVLGVVLASPATVGHDEAEVCRLPNEII
jgi:predicted PurR-regulated permease PerM